MDIHSPLLKHAINSVLNSLKNEFSPSFIVIYNKINTNVPLHGMSFSGFSNLNGFFLLDDDELDPEELRELDRLGMLRLLLLPNVPIIPLLLDELMELFSDCTTATVVVPTTDLVVVTQEVEAVVSVVVAMVTVAQLSETEVWGKEPVERDLTGASATTLSAPDTTGFLSAGS